LLGRVCIEPMTSIVQMRLRWREDRVSDGERAYDILKKAPLAAHGFFTVPKVVE
jgi:aspartyl-tRNA(Asn)/glutamyl-tRNA(Gln) amidotransferase subunit C